MRESERATVVSLPLGVVPVFAVSGRDEKHIAVAPAESDSAILPFLSVIKHLRPPYTDETSG